MTVSSYPTCLARLGGAILATSILAFPGYAQDFTITGSTSGGLQFGSGNAGATAGVNISALSATPTLSVSAIGSANFVLDTDDSDVSLSGTLSIRQTRKRTRMNAGVSYSLAPFTFEELTDDVSISTDEGERQRLSIFGGITHELTSLTSVSGNLRYTNTDFDPVTDEQVPSDDYRLSARVNHALDNRTSIFGEAGAGWFTSDTDIEIESFSADGKVGGQQQVNQNTSISGSAGASFINTEETVGGLRVDEWSTALLLDAGLQQEFADGTLSFGFSQQVTPSAAGELELNSAFTAGFEMSVNSTTSLSLNARYSRQVTIDDDERETGTLLSVSPALAIEVFDGVNATAQYTLRDTESATSHRFNIGLSRKFGGN